MISLVNYNELWCLLHQKRRGSGADWDKRASSFFRAVSNSSEAEEVIPTLNLLPTDTVLDMGAGTGRFAVPFAKHVSHLTAVEPSLGMAAFLEQGMSNAGLTNYSIVRKRWEDIQVGEDIPLHDVVFASNSLGFHDLAGGLLKLDAAAKRSVHILWFAGPDRHPMDEELRNRLGHSPYDSFGPDYIFIAHVLHDMGIYANIQVDRMKTTHTYESLDEAVSWWTERKNIEPDQVPVIREYLAEKLIPSDNGRLSMPRNGWRAHIWWNKETCAE
jgi:SAM-dependent methyltransferase